MRAYSLSPCIHISLWSGFQGVHGKENALSFCALGMMSGDVPSADLEGMRFCASGLNGKKEENIYCC